MLPSLSHHLVLSSPLQKTAVHQVCFPAHTLCPQLPAAASDGHRASEVCVVTQGQKHGVPSPLAPWDRSLSQISILLFTAMNNCAVLVSWMRKLPIFSLQEGSVFPSIVLWSLAACSAKSGKIVSAAKNVFDMFLGCNALQGSSALL